MNENYITLGELAGLVGLFVGPFLLAGGVTQFLVLRRAGLRSWMLATVLTAAVILTLFLTWGLMYIVPRVDLFGHGASFVAPGLIAAFGVTGLIALYARFRQPAA